MTARRRALLILEAQTRIEARLWREHFGQCEACDRHLLCRAAGEVVSAALDLEDAARAARHRAGMEWTKADVPPSARWLYDVAERVRRRVLAPAAYGEVQGIDVFMLAEATARVLAETGELAGAPAPPMRLPPGMLSRRSFERGQG